MSQEFTHQKLIKEHHLDFVGHMNHAAYLVVLEEIRWDILTERGYGVEKIRKSGISPVILEVNIKYKKEVRLRETITVKSTFKVTKSKVHSVAQTMYKEDGSIACVAEMKFGLMDMSQRTLVDPDQDWKKTLGIE